MGDHKRFVADNRGVSLVVGVVLMIAITVVISAAAGTLVLQITDDQLGEMSQDGVDAEFYCCVQRRHNRGGPHRGRRRPGCRATDR